ncbi:MAG: hypothetical protein VX527_00655 [Planctomycetota bacterium]|nr:hypothetical protein [Planctomycetota bacterium]
MIRMNSLLLATACLLLASSVLAVPRPNAAPSQPELTFTSGPLRIFRSNEDGQWYWYMTYGVENNTGRDQIWVPSMVLYTDQGEILEGGRRVSSAVTDEIMTYMGDPFLEPQYAIIGELKQGRGNARTGLTVWPANKTDVNELALFVAGLSSETLVVEHPLTKEDVVLRKTLKRDYLIPGRATGRGDRPVELHPDSPQHEVWIFR